MSRYDKEGQKSLRTTDAERYMAAIFDRNHKRVESQYGIVLKG
jgi:hypothetical protein